MLRCEMLINIGISNRLIRSSDKITRNYFSYRKSKSVAFCKTLEAIEATQNDVYKYFAFTLFRSICQRDGRPILIACDKF